MRCAVLRCCLKMLSSAISGLPWPTIESELWEDGFCRLGTILSETQCQELRATYADRASFRSRIDMARYRFGRGEYQYFKNPLPPVVAQLREVLYLHLWKIATDWMTTLRQDCRYPECLSAFLELCHANAQHRPTPLLLRYRAGDFNCLHQDVYGPVVFPFQVIFGLSRLEDEFSGGELLLMEQRPRAQSVGHALPLVQGEGVVIATRYRPVKGSRGYYRANLRHGVSRISRGERFSLGIIFHDAT